MTYLARFAVAVIGLAAFACAAGDRSNAEAPTTTPAASIVPAATASPAPDDRDDRSDTNELTGTTDVTDRSGKISKAAILTAVRAAGHKGFDRVVFEFAGPALPGYRIEYLDRPATQCGSGESVSLKGNARLSVRFRPANAHTENGEATVTERDMMPGLVAVKQLTSTCDFEADVEWVGGIVDAKPYRVLELKNPTRLAIDIDH